MQGIVQFYNDFVPIILRGINEEAFQEDQEFNALFNIKSGERNLGRAYYGLLGHKLANSYFISPKDRLKLFIVEQNSLNPNNIRPVPLNISIEGTFETGFQDFDIGVIYVSLETLQKKFNRENQVKSIDLKLNNVWEVNRLKKKLVAQVWRKS